MSAFPLDTPEATVPIPASATSFTDTFAFGLICSHQIFKNKVLVSARECTNSTSNVNSR